MYKSFKPEDLMAVLEGISDAVVKLDADSNYVAMNGAAADIFRRLGRDPQQMLGKSLWELFPDVKDTIVERKIREALEEHVLAENEFFPSRSALVCSAGISCSPRGYSHLPRHYTPKSYKIRLTIAGQAHNDGKVLLGLDHFTQKASNVGIVRVCCYFCE